MQLNATWQPGRERDLVENGFTLHVWLSAFAVCLKLTMLLISDTPIQNKKLKIKESPLQSQFPLHPSSNFSQFWAGSEARQAPAGLLPTLELHPYACLYK